MSTEVWGSLFQKVRLPRSLPSINPNLGDICVTGETILPSTGSSISARGGTSGALSLSRLGSGWFDIVWLLSSETLELWVHLYNCPVVSFGCYHPPPLALTIFLCPLPQWPLSLGRKECDLGVPFGAEHSRSLPLRPLAVSPLCKLSSTAKGGSSDETGKMPSSKSLRVRTQGQCTVNSLTQLWPWQPWKQLQAWSHVTTYTTAVWKLWE